MNSRALPVHCYGDPADVVERKQLHEMGCTACDSHAHLLGRVVCGDARKATNKDVPRIGSKCKFFKLKD